MRAGGAMVAYFHGMEGVESSNLFRSTPLSGVKVSLADPPIILFMMLLIEEPEA